MKRSTFIRLLLGASIAVGSGGSSALSEAIKKSTPESTISFTPKDRSLQLEMERAIAKGLDFLKTKQDPNGFWPSADYPAISALALAAFISEPTGRIRIQPPEFVKKGYDYLLRCVKEDGGIYVRDLASYNTSLGMLALVATHDEKYEGTLRRARAFLIGQQGHYPKQNDKVDPYEGGVGYGDKGPHSDMSNTSFALEALRATQYLVSGRDTPAGKDLNWDAAIAFLQRCQNHPKYNQQPWVSGDPKNFGGFVYNPLTSKADEMLLPNGKTTLRSYGSISYAGLMSYIFADLKRDDPRVTAVYDWLCKNYTLEENPGMGPQGLFYYYHTMAKALSVYGVKHLKLSDGKSIDWRQELTLKLLNLQQSDGLWVNSNGRWWEKDPVLVTSYAVRTLEIIHACM